MNLVNIAHIDPSICLDLRYATPHNFLGEAFYARGVCYLHIDVAMAVKEIQKKLRKKGLSLKIFDGYRPLSVQQMLWDKIQDARYVSNPFVDKGRHTRGTAVDVTLVDLAGCELEMPTLFDDFSERAHSHYPHISNQAKENRSLLKFFMEQGGFEQLPTEWWHFDFQGWNDDLIYPPLDKSFEELLS